jgi:hypothetical protein
MMRERNVDACVNVHIEAAGVQRLGLRPVHEFPDEQKARH